MPEMPQQNPLWKAGQTANGLQKRKKSLDSIKMVVLKSPAKLTPMTCHPHPDAWSRPDIPLHALAMYKMTRDGLTPEEHVVTGPIKQIEQIKGKAFLWHLWVMSLVLAHPENLRPIPFSGFGEDIWVSPTSEPGSMYWQQGCTYFLQYYGGCRCTGFEAPVDNMNMGDIIEIRPYEGKILNEAGETISEFEFKSDVILDEVQAGGRIPLIIGRGLTTNARAALNLGATDIFRLPVDPEAGTKGLPWPKDGWKRLAA